MSCFNSLDQPVKHILNTGSEAFKFHRIVPHWPASFGDWTVRWTKGISALSPQCSWPVEAAPHPFSSACKNKINMVYVLNYWFIQRNASHYRKQSSGSVIYAKTVNVLVRGWLYPLMKKQLPCPRWLLFPSRKTKWCGSQWKKLSFHTPHRPQRRITL